MNLSTLRQKIADTDLLILRAMDARIRFQQNLQLSLSPCSFPEMATEIRQGIQQFLVEFCKPGREDIIDEVQQAHDIFCRTIDMRLGFAREVAQAKFQTDPATYAALLSPIQRDALLALLTDLPVELRILERIREQAKWMGMPEKIAAFWASFLMPWMKELELQALIEVDQ